MSIGRLIKKVTSILLIVAMVMTSAGVHTLANSSLTAVEMAKEEKDSVGASDTVEVGDSVGESVASLDDDAVGTDDTEAVNDDFVGASVESLDDDFIGPRYVSPEAEEEENVKANSEEEPEEETTVAETESVGASSASPEETTAEETDSVGASSASPEEEESEEESTAEEETTVADEEGESVGTSESVGASSASPEETTVEETVVEEAKETIASASDALFGDGENTFTLIYNFNDKSHDGKGSTDVEIGDLYTPPTTKVVENGKEYGEFENAIGRKGYSLLGWSFERDGEVIKDTDIVDLTEDKTIYAVWEPCKYKFRITENILINGVESDGKGYIEFTFDENIYDTIKNNGLTAYTKDTNPELYDCLEFIGWGFNGYDVVAKDTDNFTDTDLVSKIIPDHYLCAVYDIAKIHVKLNANDLGYYLDEDAEDIEENRKKILDLGYCEPGTAIHKLPNYKEPIAYKDFRFERWWVPLIDKEPYDPYYKDINISPGGGKICGFTVSEDMKFIWNEEYVAHYEEDRYMITLNAGGHFYVTIGDVSNIADETGVYTDDASKFVFTTRLGKEKGGGSRFVRHIYALKGKTVKEALEEAGFEAPVAYDRDFLGWQQGKHPDRVHQKYINFDPVDFNNIKIEGPMEFTAVWKKKPLIFTFKSGPNMKYASDREEFTVEFPARDIKEGDIVYADCYEGNIYNCAGYEDPICLNNDGEEDDYNYEFTGWTTSEECLGRFINFSTIYVPPRGGREGAKGWNKDKRRYEGLEHVQMLENNYITLSQAAVFENGEYFYVDKNGRKYADGRYGGDPYSAEPYVFIPNIERIAIEVHMFSPFPVFNFGQRKQYLVLGSGTPIKNVDVFSSTSFDKVAEEGYHFAGWYQVDHDKINKTLVNFADVGKYGAVSPLMAESFEEYFEKGMPTIVGFSKPGLDTWFKYVQCTKIDDLNYAAGQYLKALDENLIINRDTGMMRDEFSNLRSKIQVNYKSAIDVIPIFTANLTLDAGEGHFEYENTEESSEGEIVKVDKITLEDLLIDTITPIREYVGAGYKVPVSNDPNKVFAGWRLGSIDGRYFGDYEAIEKDTVLVASYIDKKDSVKLTIKLHGAETTDDKGNVVLMDDIVMMLPQGTKMGDIEDDIPSFRRKGYIYWEIETGKPAWYFEYNEETGEYSSVVYDEKVLTEDTTIHLMWTQKRYLYTFVYEIDGEERACMTLIGEMGLKLKDCDLYKKYDKFKNYFNYSLENQPEKGYKITGIHMFGEAGREVTAESEIEGHITCKVLIEPLDTTITFDANGGELLGDATVTVPYASYYKDIKNIVPKASRSELAFVGWIDDKGVQVTDEYRVATSYDEANVKQATFTAQWTEKKATLVFDAGEGKFEDGSKTKTFENVPYMQLLSNIKDDEKAYEEPTLDKKVFDHWEVTHKKQYHGIEYKKDNCFGDKIYDIEDAIQSEITLKALYVDKTVTFSVKCTDPSHVLSALTFGKAPSIKERTLPRDYVFDIRDYFGFSGGVTSGGTIVRTVKEGMTFGQWLDYMYDEGYRYRGENGYQLCGWKYEEPASKAGPRKNTRDMKDVDMTAPIKDGDVFTALMAAGSFVVKIDANGGTYGKVADKETSSGVQVHQENNTLMLYANVPAGTAADKIDGMVMPRRSGYTLVGYSRYSGLENVLASNVFIAGDEYIYAIWSKNGSQKVRPTVNTRDNPGGGGSGTGSTGGTVPTQNTSAPRVGTVEGVGPQAAAAADAPKQFTQTSVSAEVQQQSQAQVTQMVAAAGISADAANSSQVQQAVAEVQAGMNIAEQYAAIANQIKENPSMTTEAAAVSHVNIPAAAAHWHTDANGNVTLEATSYDLHGSVKNVWQAVTNDAGQTGWYKFDANGYMQTGLVQDGNCTYYLSEERGAGYGQMVCNQTITIGGLTMTFNANGALTDMQYSAEAAVKTIQDAAAATTGQGIVNLSQPGDFIGPQPATEQGQVFGPQPASYLSNQPVGPGV